MLACVDARCWREVGVPGRWPHSSKRAATLASQMRWCSVSRRDLREAQAALAAAVGLAAVVSQWPREPGAGWAAGRTRGRQEASRRLSARRCSRAPLPMEGLPRSAPVKGIARVSARCS